MQTDMLVSWFPGRGYLSAASPMLVALCTCDNDYHDMQKVLITILSAQEIRVFLHLYPGYQKNMVQIFYWAPANGTR